MKFQNPTPGSERHREAMAAVILAEQVRAGHLRARELTADDPSLDDLQRRIREREGPGSPLSADVVALLRRANGLTAAERQQVRSAFTDLGLLDTTQQIGVWLDVVPDTQTADLADVLGCSQRHASAVRNKIGKPSPRARNGRRGQT